MQNLCQLFLLDTNITAIQNNKMPAARSFTFSLVQLSSALLVIVGTDKNKQPTQTGINRNK
jgi:hypothetical protein